MGGVRGGVEVLEGLVGGAGLGGGARTPPTETIITVRTDRCRLGARIFTWWSQRGEGAH